jgi:hypothetical protein
MHVPIEGWSNNPQEYLAADERGWRGSEKDRFRFVSYPRSSASIRGQILLLRNKESHVPLIHNVCGRRRRLKGSYKIVRRLQRQDNGSTGS